MGSFFVNRATGQLSFEYHFLGYLKNSGLLTVPPVPVVPVP